MIGALIDTIIAAPFHFAAAFLRSPDRQRTLNTWDPEAGKYAPKIIRHHSEWPHERWPGGGGQQPSGPRPYRSWPGGDGR